MSLPHHSLIAWRRADDLFIELHLLSRGFPAIERFELASQLRRAAFSVPANIAEGYGRHTTGEKLQFLQIACGSLAEVGYCLHAAKRLGYIEESVYLKLELRVRQDVGPVARPHEVYGSRAPLNRVPQLPCYPQAPSYPATQLPSYPATGSAAPRRGRRVWRAAQGYTLPRRQRG